MDISFPYELIWYVVSYMFWRTVNYIEDIDISFFRKLPPCVQLDGSLKLADIHNYHMDTFSLHEQPVVVE